MCQLCKDGLRYRVARPRGGMDRQLRVDGARPYSRLSVRMSRLAAAGFETLCGKNESGGDKLTLVHQQHHSRFDKPRAFERTIQPQQLPLLRDCSGQLSEQIQ